MKVYTYNDKVLTNSANGKWLKEKEVPVFVMDASNAQYYNTGSSWTYLYWEGPDFPNGYDGGSKQCVIVNNNSTSSQNLMYTNDSIAGGPTAINGSDLVTGTTTMLANQAGAASGYGKYLCVPFNSEEDARAWVANVTITIVDP